ncbi:MAG: hypothetical protein K6G58_04040 [Lachnospiraceae bacterium]|nr:hypothetical protein [Lachnospiraceae bacterium]
MKKFTKIIALAAALTMLLAVPVSAREVSFAADNTDQFLKLLNENTARVNGALADFIKVQAGPNADAAIAKQTLIVANDLAKVNKECCENHINCLSQKVYNAKVLEGTRLSQLNWFKSLYTMSPTWAPQLAFAQAEYDKAVACRITAENNLASAKIRLAQYM